MAEPMSREEILALPSVIGVEQAGRALGFQREWAYRLVKEDRFPVPVRRVGRRYRVPTAPLLDYLGIHESDHAHNTPASVSTAEPDNRRAIRTVSPLAQQVIKPEKLYRVGGVVLTGAEILGE